MKRELKIKIECKKSGHETYKIIENIKRDGCKICGELIGFENLLFKTINYDRLIDQLKDTPFEIISSK